MDDKPERVEPQGQRPRHSGSVSDLYNSLAIAVGSDSDADAEGGGPGSGATAAGAGSGGPRSSGHTPITPGASRAGSLLATMPGSSGGRAVSMEFVSPGVTGYGPRGGSGGMVHVASAPRLGALMSLSPLSPPPPLGLLFVSEDAGGSGGVDGMSTPSGRRSAFGSPMVRSASGDLAASYDGDYVGIGLGAGTGMGMGPRSRSGNDLAAV
jgi:hypothetical protein